jgi:ribonuclease E
MTIRMLINASAPNELRIAIVEDGELVELDIEAAEGGTLKGNIYKGVIHNVEGSLEAAFVDIGAHKQGFLPFSEVAPAAYSRKWTEDRAPRINDVLKRGQEIIVQVAKDAVGEKGATLSTYLSLPGRYTVLMPGSDASGISRKIEDEKTRKRIRTMAQKIKKPENCGFIVRTAGLGQTRPAIQRDLDAVVAQWEKVKAASEKARAPSILHAEPDLVARTLRDYFTDEIDEVWIDNREEYETSVAYFEQVMPSYRERLHLYQNPIPIFAYYRVEEQIEATFTRQVKLASGGSICIDQTEALVAIDVNSGRNTSEGNHEETVFKTNCEAAEEVARQLKLRDLGGIVVIDFIDMEVTQHKREVESVLADAAKSDKARYKIARINSKGICMLTRQRIRQGMRKAFQERCPVCDGVGWIRTPESHSLSLVRRIETRLAQGGVGEVRVKTHRSTAEYLNNHRRGDLLSLEREYRCRVLVLARPDMDRSQDDVHFLSKGEMLAEITDKLPAREERRRKRKRTRTAKADTGTVERENDGKSAKKKRKKKSGAKPGASSTGSEAAETAPKSGEDAGPLALEAKGNTTFTGKPSPEMLAKMKAERQARKARKRPVAGPMAEGDKDEAPSKPPSPKPSSPAEEALHHWPSPDAPVEPAPPSDPAEVEKARRSLLDRIFGPTR